MAVGKDISTDDVRQARCSKVAVEPMIVDDAQHDVDSDEVSDTECEELVLRIIRDPGTGLGMSVAGGVGTTAFKDHDEVTVCDMSN